MERRINMRIICSDSGVAVVEKAPGEECEHQLPALLSEALDGTFYPVHRLDRAVGGVMVYARTPGAAASLSRQIADRIFIKEYLAVIAGKPEPISGEMRDLVYRDARTEKAYVVTRMRRGVKEAILDYATLETTSGQDGPISLIKVRLRTGRFHQIRVQFAARGMPLAGDGKYGSRIKGCEVALYSCRIAFRHPETGKVEEYTAKPERRFPWDLFSDDKENA